MKTFKKKIKILDLSTGVRSSVHSSVCAWMYYNDKMKMINIKANRVMEGVFSKQNKAIYFYLNFLPLKM